MKYFIIGIIKFYQVFLSPIKGYKCASHYFYPNRRSCSNAVLVAVRRAGLLVGWQFYKNQTQRCKHAMISNIEPNEEKKKDNNCDKSCDVRECAIPAGHCDLGGCDGPGDCG